MIRFFSLLMLAGSLLGMINPLLAAEAAPKTRVLIVTGDDVGSHDWLTCAVATRQILLDQGAFTVEVVGGAEVLAKPEVLKNFDVIYFMMYNAKTPVLSAAGQQNLLDWVKSGKGFVVTHLASASFASWPEFRALCGRVWVMGTSGHAARGVFRAEVKDAEHPIMQGIRDFDQDDELYAKLQGDAPIHVLLQAKSDWSKQIEPLAFTLSYGEGRVFHHTFGHDVKALATPEVKRLIIQGTTWAAGK